MSNIEKKFEEIKKEMTADEKGVITFTMRGSSRILGLAENTLISAFSPDRRNSSSIAKKLTARGIDVITFATEGIKDTELALIAEYYAHEAGKYCTPEAKDTCTICLSIGLRTWGQKLLGWQPPQQYSSDFQTQVLTTLAELNTKIDNQQAELALIRPAYEEMQQITPALDKFPELMPLLKEISENIRKNPIQKKAKLKVWLESLKIAHILTRGQRQSIGKLVSDFLKIGNMEAPDKKGCNLYYEAMLPLIVLASQYVLFNQN